MQNDGEPAGDRLNRLLVEAGLAPLPSNASLRFAQYLELLLRWNARLNLTAIRDRDEILSRHFAESIACARLLPDGISSLLDFGSGAGIPGIPIALIRGEIAVTLAESQGKKAAFLREVVRTLGLSAKVHGARAEELQLRFDCVTLRAVDRMAVAVATAGSLVAVNGWLAVMTTHAEAGVILAAAGLAFRWRERIALQGGGDARILLLGERLSGQ